MSRNAEPCAHTWCHSKRCPDRCYNPSISDEEHMPSVQTQQVKRSESTKGRIEPGRRPVPLTVSGRGSTLPPPTGIKTSPNYPSPSEKLDLYMPMKQLANIVSVFSAFRSLVLGATQAALRTSLPSAGWKEGERERFHSFNLSAESIHTEAFFMTGNA